MANTQYLLHAGTQDADTLSAADGRVLFGRQGNDTLMYEGNRWGELAWLVGGRGQDTYILDTSGYTLVLETGQDTYDQIRFSSPLDYELAYELDGRHLVLTTYGAGHGVVLMDWRNPTYQIEKFHFIADNQGYSLSYQEFRDYVEAMPRFLGSIAASDLGTEVEVVDSETGEISTLVLPVGHDAFVDELYLYMDEVTEYVDAFQADTRYRIATQADQDAVLLTYQAVTGQMPADQPTVDFWVSQWEQGQSLAHIAENLGQSQAYASRFPNAESTAYAQALFEQVLGRTPTGSELNALVQQVTQQGPWNSLVQVANSTENQAQEASYLAQFPSRDIYLTLEDAYEPAPIRTATIDAALSVSRLYFAAFDRLPDQAGLNYWIDRWEWGDTLDQIATGFVDSSEFAEKVPPSSGNEYFVNALYYNVLGREPDANGQAYWLYVMQQGLPRSQVLVRFAESTENIALTADQLSGVHLDNQGEWQLFI
ncbi:protein of unknown function [Allopseudospirillum japonicum]|uniref:DUF4214 domain-containing protein n=1 Tax=Allopseudospirillum japonicum TaxID=64971 RepID=A0A1H6UNH1_9GAMM|nr:DUF4214 domain-containing protein [Allopseudospirillum japonicum]SEI92244.1 protein of unknown function [Allopseudospirillum japonicum]